MGQGTILVVEDDDDLRNSLRLVLVQRGFEVAACDTVASALQTFDTSSDKIGLVLLDLTLPDLPGLDLVRELRLRGDHCPVVLCSGVPPQLSGDEWRNLDVRSYVQKPYDITQLIDLISRITRELD